MPLLRHFLPKIAIRKQREVDGNARKIRVLSARVHFRHCVRAPYAPPTNQSVTIGVSDFFFFSRATELPLLAQKEKMSHLSTAHSSQGVII